MSFPILQGQSAPFICDYTRFASSELSTKNLYFLHDITDLDAVQSYCTGDFITFLDFILVI